MKIKDLIEILSQFNPETRVIVAGYEAGFNDITDIKLIQIKLNVNKEWYYGAHEELNQSINQDSSNLTEFTAIYLGGKNDESNSLIVEQEWKDDKIS